MIFDYQFVALVMIGLVERNAIICKYLQIEYNDSNILFDFFA